MRGSTPNFAAVSAELIAMSASCAESGFGFTAQSPYTSTRSDRHMKKTLDTTETPSRARMISKAGRIVSPCRVSRPGHHPVDVARVDDHRPEVARVSHHVERELLGHAAVLPQLEVASRVLCAKRRAERVHDLRAVDVDADRGRHARARRPGSRGSSG